MLKCVPVLLTGVFEGLSNKAIATTLNISGVDEKSALQQLFIKTGVRTRVQLVRWKTARAPGHG